MTIHEYTLHKYKYYTSTNISGIYMIFEALIHKVHYLKVQGIYIQDIAASFENLLNYSLHSTVNW